MSVFSLGAAQDNSTPLPATTTPSEGPPAIKLVDGRHNAILDAAKVSGLAVNTSDDLENLPNYVAPKFGVPITTPRGQIPGPIRNRTALIHPVAEELYEMKKEGFQPHPPMIFDAAAAATAAARPDYARFLITPPTKQEKAWCELVNQAAWWGIPEAAGTDRTFARDVQDCQWISRTSHKMSISESLSSTFFASQEHIHRHYHGFKNRKLYMTEGFWRREKGLWLSTHDVMWELLPTAELEKNFPRVSAEILQLELPIGLGIPTPCTPFYYGAQMALLQATHMNNALLMQFEECTLKETMILTIARFYCEMFYGGRLFRLKPSTIQRMREVIGDLHINLPISTAEIFSIMEKVNTYPEHLFCNVKFILPDWTQSDVPDSQFIWSLRPGPAFNNNAKHGRNIYQYLDGSTKTDKLGTSRPLTPGHTYAMRTPVKQEEINEDPRLAKFIKDEFKGAMPLLPLGELLERLSYRAYEKLSEGGQIPRLEGWI